jgi:hypothetical protein
MRQVLMEGLDLAQQLAALPFRASRQLLRDTAVARRPLGEVVQESLTIGEDLARLPFKAASALIAEMSQSRQSPAPPVPEVQPELQPDPPL